MKISKSKRAIFIALAVMVLSVASSISSEVEAEELPTNDGCNQLYSNADEIRIEIESPFGQAFENETLKSASRISEESLLEWSELGIKHTYSNKDTDQIDQDVVLMTSKFALVKGENVDPPIDENIILNWIEVERSDGRRKTIRKYEYTPVSEASMDMAHIPLSAKIVSSAHIVGCALLWNSKQIECTDPGMPSINQCEKFDGCS